MKEYDRVKLIKEKYAKEGVHKDMDGWICDSHNINGQCLFVLMTKKCSR